MADPLRPLWDFDDLEASEARFRRRLEEEGSDGARAEVLTQLARVEGLRGRFDEGDRLLDEAAAGGASASLRARVALERGRLRRSAGDPAAALPLFEEAVAAAQDEALAFVAVDALHMVALAAPDHASRLAWTARGIAAAEASDDPAVRYWLGPLWNNLGWEHADAGEREQALAAFQAALAAREADPQRPGEVVIARYAVGRALRLLGRSAEAVPLLEQAVAWAEDAGPDGWFHEELALEYAALDRGAEARPHARRALDLLAAADPSLATDEERRRQLEQLA